MYIAFEKSLLVQTAPSKDRLSAADADGVSRSILGLQVGLVALAMLVTRSSVASLQAKQGLPLGTQIVGWATLGRYCSCSLFLAAFARNWTRELDDSCDTRHQFTFLPNIVYENRHQLLAMGIFASKAQSLEDVLTVMEHPWRSCRAQSLCMRIWLGAFLIVFLPLAFFAASVFEICVRVPFKLLFESRKW